jgi:hypothetical protein
MTPVSGTHGDRAAELRTARFWLQRAAVFFVALAVVTELWKHWYGAGYALVAAAVLLFIAAAETQRARVEHVSNGLLVLGLLALAPWSDDRYVVAGLIAVAMSLAFYAALGHRRVEQLQRAGMGLIVVGGLVIGFRGDQGAFGFGAVLIVAGVLLVAAAAPTWLGRLERIGISLIALGIVIIVQPYNLQIFGAGFVLTIIGTVFFSVVSHLNERQVDAIFNRLSPRRAPAAEKVRDSG